MSGSFPGRVPAAAVLATGRLVGGVYAANTLGAIFGALITGLVLVGTVGSQIAQQALIGLAALSIAHGGHEMRHVRLGLEFEHDASLVHRRVPAAPQYEHDRQMAPDERRGRILLESALDTVVPIVRAFLATHL